MKFIIGLALVCVSLTLYGQMPDDVLTFSLGDLQSKQVSSKKRWLPFLDTQGIEAGIYHLSQDSKDTQPVHERDEIYYVLNGTARLQAGDTTLAVQPGSIAYVHANVPHHFIDVTPELNVLVLFSKAAPSQADLSSALYTLTSIEGKRNPDENVWEPFHRSGTMNFGLYMLPKVLDGDSTLTHKMDELNIVVKGQSKFNVEGKEMNAHTGDVIFVPRGLGHYFHDLMDDFEVLILFEKKSLTDK